MFRELESMRKQWMRSGNLQIRAIPEFPAMGDLNPTRALLGRRPSSIAERAIVHRGCPLFTTVDV